MALFPPNPQNKSYRPADNKANLSTHSFKKPLTLVGLAALSTVGAIAVKRGLGFEQAFPSKTIEIDSPPKEQKLTPSEEVPVAHNNRIAISQPVAPIDICSLLSDTILALNDEIRAKAELYSEVTFPLWEQRTQLAQESGIPPYAHINRQFYEELMRELPSPIVSEARQEFIAPYRTAFFELLKTRLSTLEKTNGEFVFADTLDDPPDTQKVQFSDNEGAPIDIGLWILNDTPLKDQPKEVFIYRIGSSRLYRLPLDTDSDRLVDLAKNYFDMDDNPLGDSGFPWVQHKDLPTSDQDNPLIALDLEIERVNKDLVNELAPLLRAREETMAQMVEIGCSETPYSHLDSLTLSYIGQCLPMADQSTEEIEFGTDLRLKANSKIQEIVALVNERGLPPIPDDQFPPEIRQQIERARTPMWGSSEVASHGLIRGGAVDDPIWYVWNQSATYSPNNSFELFQIKPVPEQLLEADELISTKVDDLIFYSVAGEYLNLPPEFLLPWEEDPTSEY